MECEEPLVEFFAFFAADILYHLHTCLAQLAYTRTVHLVVVVDGADDHFGDAVADDGVGAGRGLPEMRAGLQVDIQRAAFQQLLVFHGVDGVDFRVGFATTMVVALADDNPVAHDDRTHHRVRTGAAQPQGGQLQAPPHILFVTHHLLFCFRK